MRYIKGLKPKKPLNLMKKTLCLLLCLINVSLVFSQASKHKEKPLLKLETGFNQIPDFIQTTVYWYWMSDNISKEGVIRDLEAMKRVGINRAFIGNIGGEGVPYGKVKILSEEWWEIMHAALKTATRLNIEIGIFNSPGWSQSGGPWVKPAQSMRYLSSAETFVKGPLKIDQALARPHQEFQDVKVIAYPVSAGYQKSINFLKPGLTSIPKLSDLNRLTDDNDSTGISLEAKKPFVLDISTDQDYTVNSLLIKPLRSALHFSGELQVKEGVNYRTVKSFAVDHSRAELNVGFKPYGPLTVSVPTTTARQFRVVFKDIQGPAVIAEVRLASTPVVDDYIGKTLAKMWQTPLPYWDAYQWSVQTEPASGSGVIDPAKVQDISKFMSPEGKLKWEVPAGDWIIERYGMTPTGVTNAPASPEGTGLETDKMSKEHIKAHFEAFLGQIIKRIPAADRKTWKVVVADSYETGSQNWTDGMSEKFRLQYGYDPTPYLPAIQGRVVGSQDQSDRFLWDLRRFVADNVAYEYVGGLREISHQHGLHTWLEGYGHWGFPAEFLQYGGQSDEVAGEFWSFGSLGDIENRAASSTAHIYGKTKVSAESFTGADSAFSRYPAMMKQRADRFFTEGINNTLLHLYIQQAYEDKNPGVNAPFGNEFNRKNTWFFEMDDFLAYLKRCNLMLQQGRYVADVAYFISEDAPKMTGVQDPALPKGYSFDYINAEVIKTRLMVKNGRIYLPDGLSYGILVLPKLSTIRPELLAKIKELVRQGAVVLGPRPERSPSLQNYRHADAEVAALSKELWGDIDGQRIKTNRYGKGTVMEGMDLQQALDLLKIAPDMVSTAPDSVLFIHRYTQDAEIYFVSNQKNIPVSFDATFRVSGKQPELWEPLSGTARDLPSFVQGQGVTTVPLSLEATGSAFVVFRKNAVSSKNAVKSNFPKPITSTEIISPWSVVFDKGGPATAVKFDRLIDWSQSDNDSIKYYSGSAVYHNTFEIGRRAAQTRVMLNLGNVVALAKVKVNGKSVGGVWTARYTLDITSALKPGKNTLEIRVTNTWVNRLIGDSKLPAAEGKTSVNKNPYHPQSRLMVSGLNGPVKLETLAY